MRRAWLVWLLPVPFVAWAAVRVFGWERGWPWVQLMAFTPHVAVVAVVVAGGLLITRRWAAALVAVVGAVSLCAVVVPRLWGDADSTPNGRPFRLLTLNLMGGRADPAALATLVTRLDVDVLALQELTPEGDVALRAAGLFDRLPHAASFPRPGVGGSAVLSRHPVTGPSHRGLVGGAVQARATVILDDARAVEVESAHPAAPWGPPGMDHWSRDLRAQPRATPEGPLRVLLGDFNATLDHAALRRLVNTGYRDAAEASGAGLRTTWPSRWPANGRRLTLPVTLDHVLADRRLGVTEARPYLVAGTDHRAVYAELVIPRA